MKLLTAKIRAQLPVLYAQYAIFGRKNLELFAIFNYRRVGKIKFCFGQSLTKKHSVAIKQHEV
jgi:hypothetical protein